MNLHSELVASMGNPREARAWREAIRQHSKRVELIEITGDLCDVIAWSDRRLERMAVHEWNRRNRTAARAAVADSVLTSLASIYVWGVVLLHLN